MDGDFDMFADDANLRLYRPPGAFDEKKEDHDRKARYLAWRKRVAEHHKMMGTRIGSRDDDQEEDRELTASDLLDESDD